MGEKPHKLWGFCGIQHMGVWGFYDFWELPRWDFMGVFGKTGCGGFVIYGVFSMLGSD
jgi:hypothetical protein